MIFFYIVFYFVAIAMLKQIVQTVLLVTSTAVVIPYTTSLLGSLLYGWPNTKNKYRRAFSPKKVYAFNFAVLQKLYTTLKYASSYLKWKKLYNNLDPFTVRKVNNEPNCQICTFKCPLPCLSLSER